MLFPMEPTIVREFAEGTGRDLRHRGEAPFLEMFAKQVLYGRANAPRIVGKFDEEEKELLPHYGEFESDVIVPRAAEAPVAQDPHRVGRNWIRAWTRSRPQQAADRRCAPPGSARAARTTPRPGPEGSMVSAGIGCPPWRCGWTATW